MVTVADQPCRLQPVVGDDPRGPRVAAQPGRDRAALEAPAQRGDDLGDAIGQLDPRALAAEGAHPLAGDPPVGRDVEHAVEALAHGEVDGGGEVVEVEELGGGILLAEALAEAGGERAGELRRPVGGHRHDGAQHGDRAPRSLPAPAVGHRLGGGELAGVDELDVGAQDGVLGERHRVVRPRRRTPSPTTRSTRWSASRAIASASVLVDAFGDVLAAAGPGVVVAGTEVDHDVDRTVSAAASSIDGSAVELAEHAARRGHPRRR